MIILYPPPIRVVWQCACTLWISLLNLPMPKRLDLQWPNLVSQHRGIFQGGQPCPIQRELGSSIPKFLGPHMPIRFHPEVPNSAWKHMWVKGMLLEGQMWPLSQGVGVGPSPNFFSGTSNTCPHGITNTNQNLHGDQIRWKEKFTGWTNAPTWPKISVTQMW